MIDTTICNNVNAWSAEARAKKMRETMATKIAKKNHHKKMILKIAKAITITIVVIIYSIFIVIAAKHGVFLYQ